METVYPHCPTVTRVTPYTGAEGKGHVAYVGLAYGPVFIRARLTRNERGGLFLSMPSRKGENDNWYEQAAITDRTLLVEFERLAILGYHEAIANQFQMVGA